jgi:glutamate carboxypeptidase
VAEDVSAEVRLRSWLDARQGELVEDLRALVKLETPSDDKARLDAGLDAVLAWVRRRLGPESRLQRYPSPEVGEAVALDLGGAGPGGRVLLLGHYDTVWPTGTVNSFGWSTDGLLIRGPGTFDMKGGLVQLVWALAAAAAAAWELPPVRLILNGDEETGSRFSRPFVEAEADGAAYALVFEGSDPDGSLKTARKGIGHFQVEVVGVEAHAGLDPCGGVSAVHELAHLVATVAGLADLAVGTTVNVGVVEGGTRRNVTAGRALAQLEVRTATAAEAHRVEAALRALAPRDARARVAVSGDWHRPIFERSEAGGRLFAVAREVAGRLGFDLGEVAAGGGSDGNLVAALGIPVLDGLGAVGGGAHARTEHIRAAGLVERAALVAGLLRELAARERGTTR